MAFLSRGKKKTEGLGLDFGGTRMSFTELAFVMILGLILFGPEELPKVARTIGKIIYEVKKASQDVQTEVRKSIVDPVEKKINPVETVDLTKATAQDLNGDKE